MSGKQAAKIGTVPSGSAEAISSGAAERPSPDAHDGAVQPDGHAQTRSRSPRNRGGGRGRGGRGPVNSTLGRPRGRGGGRGRGVVGGVATINFDEVRSALASQSASSTSLPVWNDPNGGFVIQTASGALRRYGDCLSQPGVKS